MILILKSKFKKIAAFGSSYTGCFLSWGNYWLHDCAQQFKVYQPVSFACDYRTLWRFDELTIFRPLPTIDSTLSPDMNLRSQCVQTTPHNKFKNGWNNDSFTDFPHGSGHEHCHGWHRRQDPR
ncbi:hypothetical protein, partial [Pseudomonas sp. MD195_PC81_125]|uniref:hypothetical protein n=1 Tax=Pseudomonas sp. MD195_PC81_125 TaxID=2741560 RepID=UPI001C714CAF